MGIKGLKGFTMIELLLVIAVAGMFAAMAIPSLDGLVKRNRIVSVTNDFLATYQLARDEAMLRGRRVTVCRRQQPATETAVCTNANLGDDAHCSCATSNSPATADGWEDGWLVFEDTNENNVADNGEALIRVYDPINGLFTVRDADGSPHNSRVFFEPDGTSIAGSLQVCLVGTDTAADSERIRTARRILVSRIGQANILNGVGCDV